MATADATERGEPGPLVLFDGTCGLCHGAVRFALARERHDRLRFAPLQSPLARGLLERHGHDPERLATFVLVRDHGTPAERLELRGRAALSLLGELRAPWRWLAPLRHLPTWLVDPGYRLIARLRYRLFGRRDACALPAPEQRERFLDGAPP